MYIYCSLSWWIYRWIYIIIKDQAIYIVDMLFIVINK